MKKLFFIFLLSLSECSISRTSYVILLKLRQAGLEQDLQVPEAEQAVGLYELAEKRVTVEAEKHTWHADTLPSSVYVSTCPHTVRVPTCSVTSIFLSSGRSREYHKLKSKITSRKRILPCESKDRYKNRMKY